jgi:FdhE protein
MSAAATVRVMSPEEIAASAGGETPFLQWPERSSVFAERAMRLRQLAAGHPMGDYLRFVADLALAQQAALKAFADVPLPDAAAIDRAASAGLPPLPAADWPRDPAWQDALRAIVATLKAQAPPAAQAALERLHAAGPDSLERQADALLTGVTAGLDLAWAPVVAGALQVYWTHLVLAVQARHAGGGQPIGRLDDATVCPACGSRPVASLVRTGGGALGQRYLHCSLCSLQWHMVRIQCAHCLSSKSLAYQSLDTLDSDDEAAARAAKAAVQAETCDDCGHYLKILHNERDPFIEPVADDLASLTLDLLVSESGRRRHGVNLMLLFGPPEGDAPAGAPPPAAGPG